VEDQQVRELLEAARGGDTALATADELVGEGEES
jgi:hypothetical protein